MTSNKNQHSYEFKGFRLDVSERRLLRDSSPVPLTPKVFDVLAVLVERRGHLIEKDELLRVVWDDAFVEESNVARIIHTLRKTLGENNANKFIETVAKKGYRFVAEVSEVNGSLAETADGLPEPTREDCVSYVLRTGDDLVLAEKQNGRQHSEGGPGVSTPDPEIDRLQINRHFSGRERLIWILGTVVILAVLATGVWFAKNPFTEDGSRESKSLAVLPLKPISNESRDPIYELGIAESLILKLSSAKKLTVRPLSATRKYLELDQNPTIAGKEQEVDFVLSSNYQVADGKIRVTSQLIDVRSGNIEDVFKSERSFANVFSMQDAIANDIGNTILTRFGGRENSLTAKRGTENEEAYRLFLRAVYIFDQVNKAEAGKAIGYLEQAVRLDPNFADAYATLAFGYGYMTATQSLSSREQYRRARAAAEKALELDPNMAEAHAALGMVKANFEGDFAGAEREYKRAIELDPGSSAAHAMYALQLAGAGRFDDGIAEIKMAILVDPATISHHVTHGMILYYAHRYNDALAQFKRIQEMDPDLGYSYFWQWLLYDLQGDETRAYEWFVKYKHKIRADSDAIKRYETAYQKSGWKGVLREHIVQDEKNLALGNASTLYYEMACFSGRLGNKDQAFEYLNKAYEERGLGMTLIKVDPYLDSLHGDPRFDELVKKVGLK